MTAATNYHTKDGHLNLNLFPIGDYIKESQRYDDIISLDYYLDGNNKCHVCLGFVDCANQRLIDCFEDYAKKVAYFLFSEGIVRNFDQFIFYQLDKQRDFVRKDKISLVEMKNLTSENPILVAFKGMSDNCPFILK